LAQKTESYSMSAISVTGAFDCALIRTGSRPARSRFFLVATNDEFAAHRECV
jgi:hypothetical protein